MTLTIDLVLLLIAAICFVAAALGVSGRVNLTAAGLFLWILSVIV